MKTFVLVLLLVVLILPAQGQQIILRSDSAKYVPGTTWDSVYVGDAGRSRAVWIGVSHLSGNSNFAIASENDTSVSGKKRLYIYPSNGFQWFAPIKAKFIRRRAIGGDSCHVQTYILAN